MVAQADKEIARGLAWAAYQRGEIARPACCVLCGSSKRLVMHHEDYNKPLDVTWLCYPCHMGHHISKTVQAQETLKDKRLRVYNAIVTMTEDRGYPPSMREVQAYCGLSSVSVVAYHIKALVADGWLSESGRTVRRHSPN